MGPGVRVDLGDFRGTGEDNRAMLLEYAWVFQLIEANH